MENNTTPPTEIQALAQSVKALGLHHEFAIRVLAVLEEHNRLMYALREDMKLLRATSASADRLSRECMIKVCDLQREIRSSK